MINNDTTEYDTTEYNRKGYNKADRRSQHDENDDSENEENKVIDVRSPEYTPDKYVEVINPLEYMEGNFFKVEDMPEEQRTNVEDMTFQEWNRKQESHNRILHPTKFDLEPPTEIDFGKIEKDQPYVKPDGTQGTFSYVNFNRKGKTKGGISIIGPTVISSRGLCCLKEGCPDCIPFILDMENPHHRHFIYHTYAGFIRVIIEKIMENTGVFGIQTKAFNNITDDVRNTDKYRNAYKTINDSIKHFYRYPKDSEGSVDVESKILMGFCNTINKPQTEKSKEFKTSVKILTKRGTENCSLEVLKRINQGYYIEDGELKKGESKSMEFSFEIQFQRIAKTAGIGLKATTTTLFIYDFFKGKVLKRKSDMHAEEAAEDLCLVENGCNFDEFLGIKNFKIEDAEEKQERSEHRLRDQRTERKLLDDETIYSERKIEAGQMLMNMSNNKMETINDDDNESVFGN